MKIVGLILFVCLIVGVFAQAIIRLFMVDPTPAIVIPIVLVIIGWGLWSLEDL